MGLMSCVFLTIGMRCFGIMLGQNVEHRTFDYLTNINGLKNLRKKLEETGMTLEQTFLAAVGIRYPLHKLERVIAHTEKFCKERSLDWAIEPGEDDRYQVTIHPRDGSWGFICCEGPQLRELIYMAVAQASSNVNYHGLGKVISLNAWKGRNNG